MMYMTCVDLGNKYLVSNVTKIEPFINAETVSFEINDTAIFAFLVENIVNGKKVYFPKNVEELTLGDFYFDDNSNSLFAFKEQTWFRLSKVASRRISKITLFDFFRYSYLNSKFSQAGYDLTGDDVEEKYISILEKNDPEEVYLLEDYLNTTTKIKKFESLYMDLRIAEDRLMSATSEEEAQAIFDEFKGKYN